MISIFTQIKFYPAPVRLGIFVFCLIVIWLPLALPIYLLLSRDNLVTILTMGLLFIEFLLLLNFWSKKVYQQPRLLNSYGLVWTSQNGIDLLKGLSFGLFFTLSLFVLEGAFGWLKFHIPSITLIGIIAEGLLSALGIGLAEELLFRGWLLDELQRDYHPRIVLWTDAIIFACLHFLKPLGEIIRTSIQFPGLLLLGLTLVWAKRHCQGRLGIAIGIHAGLVWGYYILNVGKLIEYSNRVPPWITGIDGHPLAGVMGLLFLGVLAFWMRKRAINSNFSSSKSY